MKTISTKLNPAFKLAQPMPLLPSIPAPRAASAAVDTAKITPSPSGLQRTMTDLAVCALNVSKNFNPTTVRLTN